MADDLNATRGSRRLAGLVRRRRPPLVNALVGLFALLAAAAVGYVLIVDDPLGGEPVAVALIDRPAGDRPGGDPAAGAEGLTMRSTIERDEAVEPLPRGHDLPPADIVIRDPFEAEMPEIAGGGTSSAIGELTEASRHGVLPAVAPDGRRPAEAYARPAPAGGGARIAIVVNGMGLSTTSSEMAIERLPGEVSLAFAPYGREIERLTGLARQDGHELLIQVPLEPYDYPDNDPGPHTLLTGLDAEQNRDRLHWVMSRFTGYVGATNYLGARFTATTEPVRRFLGELRDRGLVYVDDGGSGRSVVADVAAEIGMSFARGHVVIDAEPTAAAIAEALGELENAATSHGAAIGVASALPVSIEAIADWARGLESKGITLVPVTAVVSGGEI